MATLKDNEAFTSCIFLKHMGDFLFMACAGAFQKEHDLSEKLFKDIKDVLAPGRCIKASCRASFPQDLKINRCSGAGRQNYKFQCRACNTLNPLPEPKPEDALKVDRQEGGDGNSAPQIREEPSERPQQEQEIRQENASGPEPNHSADYPSRSRGLAAGSSLSEAERRDPVEERDGSQNERTGRREGRRNHSRHYRPTRTQRITHRVTTASTPRSTAPSRGKQRRVASKMYESSGREGMRKFVVGLKRKDRARSESSEIHEDIREDGMPFRPLESGRYQVRGKLRRRESPDMDENRGKSNRRGKSVHFSLDELPEEINSSEGYRRREKRKEMARLSERKARLKRKEKSGFMQRILAGFRK